LVFFADQAVTSWTIRDVDAYLATWRMTFIRRYGNEPTAATYRNRVNALRAFYAWLERFDLIRSADGTRLTNPMRWVDAPRVEQKANDWLRPAEDRALLSASMPAHEGLIILLLRWSGLRVGEAVSLAVSDIDVTNGRETILVRRSKTPAGRRAIPVLPALRSRLRTHLIELQKTRITAYDTPLLVTRNGTAMKPSYVWRVVKRASFRAGIRVVPCTCQTPSSSHLSSCPRTQTGEHLSRVSPHTLRRTFGSDLLNRGVRLEVVSKLLGHASTTVTEKAYAQLLHETTRREVLAAFARTATRK